MVKDSELRKLNLLTHLLGQNVKYYVRLFLRRHVLSIKISEDILNPIEAIKNEITQAGEKLNDNGFETFNISDLKTQISDITEQYEDNSERIKKINNLVLQNIKTITSIKHDLRKELLAIDNNEYIDSAKRFKLLQEIAAKWQNLLEKCHNLNVQYILHMKNNTPKMEELFSTIKNLKNLLPKGVIQLDSLIEQLNEYEREPSFEVPFATVRKPKLTFKRWSEILSFLSDRSDETIRNIESSIRELRNQGSDTLNLINNNLNLNSLPKEARIDLKIINDLEIFVTDYNADMSGILTRYKELEREYRDIINENDIVAFMHSTLLEYIAEYNRYEDWNNMQIEAQKEKTEKIMMHFSKIMMDLQKQFNN